MEMPLRRVPADTGADVQSEPRTFDAFYESVHRPLFGALRVITGNRTDAEDISQEAFLRVWERWERVALMDNPEAFLFRTAMNVFRNRSRRARLALRRTVGGFDPRDELAEVEERDLVERALRPLTPRERAAVVLTCYVGLTSQEAGRVLRIRPGAVRTLTARARVAMKTVMEESR
jgi:RNA polymerase sigma-70 factor (ECF subfamily)